MINSTRKMWRTFVVPVLQKQVGLLRNSSGYGSSRIYSVHIAGHECSDNNVKPSVTDSNNQNVVKAQNTVVGLLLKLHDDSKKYPSKVETHIPFIEHLLDHINRHTDLAAQSKKSDLTICTPKSRRDGKGSRFGFKNILMDFEKWCYGVVVVSSLISWHRLLFKDGRKNDNQPSSVWNICDFVNVSEPLRILPTNSPAKPIDPLDAACSSLESAIADCTAVTENALAIQFLNLKLFEKAFKFFQSASKKGNVAAHFNVGLCYEEGLGTPQDTSKAVSSYIIAASHGHQHAAFNLGIIFLQGKYYSGKENDGLEMMEKAAKGGLVKAQRFLGLYYANDSNKHYDMKKSVQWLKMASEQKDAKAQYHLGICYERGLGVARNMQKAKQMYGSAAENGHAGAQYNYAVFHEQGWGGLCVDKYEALRWYSIAAKNGNVNAKENLKLIEKEIGFQKRTPNLLERLFSDIWISKQPTSSSGTMPRCSSCPSSLFNMQSDLDSSQSTHESRAGEQQSIVYEDSKCVWVI